MNPLNLMPAPYRLPLVLLVFGLLVAGNVLLGRAYLGQRDATTTARAATTTAIGERDGARALAGACSDATEDLRELADKRKTEADDARKAAAVQARPHEQRADAILAAPPAVPGEACASAQRRVDGWLKGRMAP